MSWVRRVYVKATLDPHKTVEGRHARLVQKNIEIHVFLLPQSSSTMLQRIVRINACMYGCMYTLSIYVCTCNWRASNVGYDRPVTPNLKSTSEVGGEWDRNAVLSV